MHPLKILLPFLALLALAGCGGSSSKPATSATHAASAPAQSTAVACQRVSAPAPKGTQHLRAPKLHLDPSHAYTATLETTCGTIGIALDVHSSPKTVASFVYLARRHFYDGLTFHRIVPGFVIQGGDPLGSGHGGPGYNVVERPPASTRYTQGVVAMAKTAIQPPGASGSQFFIVTGTAAALPADYAVLGEVSAGADAVARIAAVPADPQSGVPADTVEIKRVSISG